MFVTYLVFIFLASLIGNTIELALFEFRKLASPLKNWSL